MSAWWFEEEYTLNCQKIYETEENELVYELNFFDLDEFLNFIRYCISKDVEILIKTGLRIEMFDEEIEKIQEAWEWDKVEEASKK